MLDFRSGVEFLFHFLDRVGELEAGAENEAVRFFEVALHFRADVVSREPDAVETADTDRISFDEGEGADILHDTGHAADHAALPDFHELVDARHAADDRVVFDRDVARDAGEAGNDDAVSQIAVVRDMDVGLQHVVRTDAGFAVFARRAVDGAIFADEVSVTDDDGRVFARVFEVLRVFPDDSTGINMVLAPHADVFRDDCMRTDDGAFADFTMGTNDRVGTNDDIFVKNGGGIDHGRGMDFRFHLLYDFKFHLFLRISRKSAAGPWARISFIIYNTI